VTAAAGVSDSGYRSLLLQQDRRILLLHSGNVLCMLVSAVTVTGWADAEKELKSVAEIVAVVAIESVGAIVDSELSAETNVDAFAMRQVANVTQRVTGHGKDACVRGLVEDQLMPGLSYVLPSKIDRVAATLIV